LSRPKGKLDFELPRRTSAKVDGANVLVSRDGEDSEAKALHGLSRAIVNNMVKGSAKVLSRSWNPGVGFKARCRARMSTWPWVFAPGQLSDPGPDQGDS